MGVWPFKSVTLAESPLQPPSRVCMTLQSCQRRGEGEGGMMRDGGMGGKKVRGIKEMGIAEKESEESGRE